NDQPVVADLLSDPQTGDMSIICTNVRTLDGRRPVFIDATDSTFVFPYAGIRFVEIPSGKAPKPERSESSGEPEELEIDEDFLRRVRDA
ncbi:MAG TPA: hypothetical protein VFW86_04055, partial [Candidatus Limnocylindrales bacterium]|nr:hypothetical protein [Candidatus Limnocylindrales bacterium]